MIFGIGVDIVEVTRIDRSYARFGDRFAGKILTPKELDRFQQSRHKVAYLAKRFAAKEAVAKALGTGMRQGVRFTGIEVLNEASGAPGITLLDSTLEFAQTVKVSRVLISLSDEKHSAVAFAIAESD